MKTLAILLLTTLSCFAQYRLHPNTAYETSTNSSTTLAANTNLTTASFYVGAGSACIVWSKFKLVDTNAAGTNPITMTLRKGPHGSYQSNFATFTLTATTNAETWDSTNVNVADATYMSAVITNGNSIAATNFLLRFDQKQGL